LIEYIFAALVSIIKRPAPKVCPYGPFRAFTLSLEKIDNIGAGL
jgi:hypothetical protein